MIDDYTSILPNVKGRYRQRANLANSNWFQVGGCADILFKPEDVADLAAFISNKPDNIPVTVIGVGSNIIVRDGGIKGVVIKLGRKFAQCKLQDGLIFAGAACLDVNVAQYAYDLGIGGFEFLSGIPGTIGGALAMNAGAYGSDMSKIVRKVEVVDGNGEIRCVAPDIFEYGYRKAKIPKGWIITGVWMQGVQASSEQIAAKMEHIKQQRLQSQPVRSRTGGSTFKNPTGYKAWQLIDEAGCRGLSVGKAEMSQQHCNFMINHGGATAHDLESLGEIVRDRVYATTGIMLEWEIRILGCKKADGMCEH